MELFFKNDSSQTFTGNSPLQAELHRTKNFRKLSKLSKILDYRHLLTA